MVVVFEGLEGKEIKPAFQEINGTRFFKQQNYKQIFACFFLALKVEIKGKLKEGN